MDTSIYTIEELCEILKISKSKAYSLLQNQEIKAFKCGTKWKIPEDEVVRYIYKKLNTIN